MRVLGISLGHDSSAALVEDGRLKGIMEAERYFRQKRYKLHCVTLDAGRHASGFQYVQLADLIEFLGQVAARWGRSFDAVAVQNQGRRDEFDNLLVLLGREGFTYSSTTHVDHHLSHASLAYYTSPFDRAIVLSYDGMGNDGFTVLFKGEGNRLDYLERDSHQFGRSYNNVGYVIGIKPDVAGSTAGKSMGLAAYGELRSDWLPFAREYVATYQKLSPVPVEGLSSYGKSHRINSAGLDRIPDLRSYVRKAATAGTGLRATVGALLGASQTELVLPGPDNALSQSLMHTVQHAWTEEVLSVLEKFSAHSRNLCVVGGCALNGVTNYVIQERQRFNRCYFLPNPTDCGLSGGAALHTYYARTDAPFAGIEQTLTPYLGAEPFDAAMLPSLRQRYPHRRFAGSEQDLAARLASLIHRDRIVGVIRGPYEVGPRALGNRSILCNPLNPSMRDILNERVKHREWYRPFAPVVTSEDASRYFTNAADIPYMSVICYTRDEYRSRLPSITHVDGSARLQTVTAAQHPFIHAALKAFERLSGFPILLNTSFNPGGEPILNFCSVGLGMLDSTQMDLVLIGDEFFCKPGNERLLDETALA